MSKGADQAHTGLFPPPTSTGNPTSPQFPHFGSHSPGPEAAFQPGPGPGPVEYGSLFSDPASGYYPEATGSTADLSIRRASSMLSETHDTGHAGEDLEDATAKHVPMAVKQETINDYLFKLCNIVKDKIPDMQLNVVYEVNNWINFPVQILFSNFHGYGDYYMSTRSIGEFVLHLLHANMNVKTNMTTTIVRKFRAVEPETWRYGLLVKTVGQKPEKTFNVEAIPQSGAPLPPQSGRGRGSHKNSRGTSYYWPLSYIGKITNSLIHTINKSKAFKDIHFYKTPPQEILDACGPNGNVAHALEHSAKAGHLGAPQNKGMKQIGEPFIVYGPPGVMGLTIPEENVPDQANVSNPSKPPRTLSQVGKKDMPTKQQEVEIMRSIEAKKRHIEELQRQLSHLHNQITGLSFEVAAEEQMLRQMRGEEAVGGDPNYSQGNYPLQQ
eukprot:Clim_evm27s151 gene=Clim_evmTU27s151